LGSQRKRVERVERGEISNEVGREDGEKEVVLFNIFAMVVD
jgi:hypothetical protein